jgi:hypothetical protein
VFIDQCVFMGVLFPIHKKVCMYVLSTKNFFTLSMQLRFNCDFPCSEYATFSLLFSRVVTAGLVRRD